MARSDLGPETGENKLNANFSFIDYNNNNIWNIESLQGSHLNKGKTIFEQNLQVTEDLLADGILCFFFAIQSFGNLLQKGNLFNFKILYLK